MDPNEVIQAIQATVTTLAASQASHQNLIVQANADISAQDQNLAAAQAAHDIAVAGDHAAIALQTQFVGEYQAAIDDLSALIAKLAPAQ